MNNNRSKEGNHDRLKRQDKKTNFSLRAHRKIKKKKKKKKFISMPTSYLALK